jgi:hypothetical protein
MARPVVLYVLLATAAGSCSVGCKTFSEGGDAAGEAASESTVLGDAEFVPLGASGPEAILVVTDLDDTLQIANVQKGSELARTIKAQRAFPGMPTLIRVLAAKAEGRIYVIGNRPASQIAASGPFLRKHGLGSVVDAKQVLLRDDGAKVKPKTPSAPASTGEPPTDPLFDYKKAQLESILDRYVPSIALTSVVPAITRVILIGDDTDVDPDVFEHVLDRYGERVKVDVYIRRVVGSTLIPRAFTRFYDPLEIALNELEQGALTTEEAASVGRAVLWKSCELDAACAMSEGDAVPDDDLVPKFHSCPGALEPMGALADELESLRAQISERTQRICETRAPAPVWGQESEVLGDE